MLLITITPELKYTFITLLVILFIVGFCAIQYLRKNQTLSGTIRNVSDEDDDYNDLEIDTGQAIKKVHVYKRENAPYYKAGDYITLKKKRVESIYEFDFLQGVH